MQLRLSKNHKNRYLGPSGTHFGPKTCSVSPVRDQCGALGPKIWVWDKSHKYKKCSPSQYKTFLYFHFFSKIDTLPKKQQKLIFQKNLDPEAFIGLVPDGISKKKFFDNFLFFLNIFARKFHCLQMNPRKKVSWSHLYKPNLTWPSGTTGSLVFVQLPALSSRCSLLSSLCRWVDG